jgi:general secretion pathway protein D
MTNVLKTYTMIFLGLGVFWGSPFLRASSEEILNQELQRRQVLAKPLDEALKNSNILAQQGNLLEAYNTLEKAYSAVSESIRQTSLGASVRFKLSELGARLAESASKKNHWPEARKRALAALSYDPNCLLGQDILARSDEVMRRGAVGDEEVNPALTTKFFDHLNDVNQGLEEAKALRETGQLDIAEKKYESVLKVDPFNQVATEGIKKIYQERALVAEKSRDLSNLERRREVREAWNNIYPKINNTSGGIAAISPMTASPNFVLESKLRKTIIPQIDFSGADMDTIRRALNTLSRQYDPDGEKKGINFVVSADLTDAQLVSLKLRSASLEDVVHYISQIAGVKARVNADIGVVFAPLVEKRPDLIPRTYTVSPSFFKESTGGGSESVSAGIRGGVGATPAAAENTGNKSAQKRLEELGVKFPEGGYAIYNRNTSQLKVANNAEMLDLIGQLISAAEEQTLLIQIGCRLVEINQSDLDSLTVNSTLGGSGLNLLSPIPVGLSTNGSGGTPAGSTQKGVTAQMNQIQGVGLLPNNTLTSFLQNGVLAGTNQSSSYALNTLDLGGTIFNGMQFRTFIAAISQKNSANVLANPSITLKRGQKGVIEVSQEFKYVKEYNDPQSSIRTFTPTSLNGTGNSQQQTAVPGPETVISSFPSQISDAVPIGVKMDVKPDVTGDNTRVLLEIVPSFVDFEGFINYGTVINSAYAATYYNVTTTILTNNIQQPVFIRRDVKLEPVEVNDGYTLMLGGLLREDIQKIDEKVPIIGDIPLLGRAFQGKTEQALKKNTLIFVTPRILTVDGQPLNPTAGAPTTAASGP